MTLQINRTCFPDSTQIEHGSKHSLPDGSIVTQVGIEETILWDKCKDWRKEQAKRKPKARIIPSWDANKMRKVV